jgi:polyhydroxybutyrate depolymerase
MNGRRVPAVTILLAFGCSLPDDTTQPPPLTGGSAGTGAAGGAMPTGGSSGAAARGGSAGAGNAGGLGGAAGNATGGSGTFGGSGGTLANGGSAASAEPGGGKGGASGSGGGAGRAGAAATGGAAGGGGSGTGGAVSSLGCGKAPPASERYSIDVDGAMREYIIAIPDDYEPTRPYPLVFAWHPLGGSAQQVAGMSSNGYYGLRAQADGDAIFVAPEGLPFNGGNLGWANANGGDIEFLRSMLDRFGGELCIDESRIFSTGFSFGGMMSFAVGCAMGGVFRAIVPMAGNTQVSGCVSGTEPVALLGFHGLDDTVVSIDGGRRGRDEFVERNGCTDQTMPADPNWCGGVAENYQPCSCVSYQGCTAGYPVVWCEFTGPHTPAPSSATTIWNFFSQF